MATAVRSDSPRRNELLERAYPYVLEHGLADLALPPLAAAVGSSSRVLLFLFGSKAEPVPALLTRACEDELDSLHRIRETSQGGDSALVAAQVWGWLAAEEHRALLRLWVEGHARSPVDPAGPWGDFARRTVGDWLDLLADAESPAGEAERTLLLAVLRGALIDLLATEDVERTTGAVTRYLDAAS